MSGTLYVVATPIGNLEDITLRALRVLREVDVIAAEDTRRTARLLNHHAISTRTISFHVHNAHNRVPKLLERLAGGGNVAIVTDAGTPGISDPGLELVQAALASGITVDPIPGASAPLAALIASGFALVPFTIYGFPPIRPKARDVWLQEVNSTDHAFSFFEAPHRIRQTMVQAASYFGERPIVLARELTKMHQEFVRGTTRELIERLGDPKGEFTVVVGPSTKLATDGSLVVSDDDLVHEFWRITESGGSSRREAVRQVAHSSGRSAKDVYSLIERAKKLV